MNKRKWNYIDFLFVVYLFIYIFNPPIISINTRTICDLFNASFFMIRTAAYRKLFLRKTDFKLFANFIPFIAYISLLFAFNVFFRGEVSLKDYYLNIHSIIITFARIFLVVYVFRTIYEYRNYDIYSVGNIFMIVGIIQAIFVIVTLFSTRIHMFLFEKMLSTYTVERASQLKTMAYRSYGFSENVYDSFGYIMSLLTMFACVRMISYEKVKYAIAFIFMLIPPFFNTRTGLLLDMVVLFICIFVYRKKLLTRKLVMYSSYALIALVAFVVIINYAPESTLNFVKRGVEQTYLLFIKGERTGVYNALWDDVILPGNVFFGAGFKPSAIKKEYEGIDVGYIQCIWRYGIMGTLLLFFGMVRLFVISYKNSRRAGDREMLCYVLNIFFVYFIYLFKLFSVTNIGALVIIVPVCVLCSGQKRIVKMEDENARGFNKRDYTCVQC